MRPRLLLVPLLLLVAGLPALCCTKGSDKASPSDSAAHAQSPPLRIISMAPSITEILFALGLGDNVVGVSDFCDYPPEAATRPKIGGVVNPNLEAIIALDPDLVLGLPNATHENLFRSLRQLGIKMLALPNESIEEMCAMIRAIGRETATEQRAEQLINRLQTRFAEINARVADQPRRKVMFIVGVDPLFVAGGGTFIDELITLAGGENIAGDSLMKYPQLGIEEVISKAPDVILYTSLNFELTGKQEQQAKKLWSAYSTLPAVKEDRIYGLVADHVTLAGPRLEIGLEEMARAIHPEAFPQQDRQKG